MLTWLFLALASAAPEDLPAADAPGTVMPTRWWDVTHLHLDVTIDIEAGTVRGRTTHDIQPLAMPRRAIRLHQVALDILGVKVDGEPTRWTLGSDFIEVPIEPGKPHQIEISYEATPQTGLHFRRPGRSARVLEAWSQGEGEDHRHWFPSWDYPNDRFTVSTDITVPDELTAIGNGVLTGKAAAESGWTTWSYALEQDIVNYLVVVAAGEYRSDLLKAEIPMEIWSPKDLPSEQILPGLDQAPAMLTWFNNLLGTPYPYPIYRQINVQGFLYGGMENASATILSEDLLMTRPTVRVRRPESVVAHELAHQWFGDLLTCYGWRELWLNEGFATHYTNRWMDHRYGPAYAAIRRRNSYRSAARQKVPVAVRSWNRNGDLNNAGVYTRGSTVLHMLEVHLGRATFDAGIKAYVAANAGRLVETEDLRRSLEDVSGTDLGWMFDQWIHRGGMPTFAVTHRVDRTAETQLIVRIEQKTEGTPFYAPVDIEIGTSDGIITRKVWVQDGKTELVVDLTADLLWVLADPQRGVLAEWNQTQTPAQWQAAATQSAHWDGRLEALTMLSHGTPPPDSLDLLKLAATLRDLEMEVRIHAIESLRQVKTTGSASRLRDLARNDNGQIRAAAMEGLAHQATTPATTAALVEGLTDPDINVEIAALRSLSEHDSDAALIQARRRLKGDYDLRRGAMRVLGKYGEAKDLPKLLVHLEPSFHRGVRGEGADAAATLVVRLEPDGKGRLTAAFSRATQALLDADDQRLRSRALSALRRAGDRASAPILQAYAQRTHLASHAERALAAAAEIRNGRKPHSPAPSDTDIERLNERLDAIDKDLKRLKQWR